VLIARDRDPAVANPEDLGRVHLSRGAAVAEVDRLAATADDGGQGQNEWGGTPGRGRSSHHAMLPSAAMTSRAAALVALLVAGPLAAAGSAADAPATKVRLQVSADPACSTRSDLAARVGERSPRIVFVDDTAVDFQVTVQVTLTSSRPGNVVADLVLAAPGAGQPPRRVVARSCAEAADAVALIIALTLDPTQRREVSASPAAGGPPSSPARAAAPPPVTPPEIVPGAPPPETVRAAAPSPPSPSAPPRRQLGVSVAAQTVFGAAPRVMPGIALYAMAARERAGLWAPALVIGATHVWRDDLAEPGGTASFTLDAASLDLCPVRVRLGWLEARPCASALLGRMSARGSQTENGASASRPFAVGGAAVTAGFGSVIELSLRVAVGVTLIRDSYQFATDVFHRAGLLTTSASLGLGVRWR
jgi:hypothetical protein